MMCASCIITGGKPCLSAFVSSCVWSTLQVDKLATDVVMQAAAGNYKPVSIVVESLHIEPMDVEMDQHNTACVEQSNDLSSHVCIAMFVVCCIL